MSNDVASDGIATAQLAGLRYTNDDQPGIRRKRSGRGFAYTDRDGVPIRDKGELGRIRRLAIPPAWTDVWISPSPIGHIQATGRDARGRKQYRYHERWREVRDEAKYWREQASHANECSRRPCASWIRRSCVLATASTRARTDRSG